MHGAALDVRVFGIRDDCDLEVVRILFSSVLCGSEGFQGSSGWCGVSFCCLVSAAASLSPSISLCSGYVLLCFSSSRSWFASITIRLVDHTRQCHCAYSWTMSVIYPSSLVLFQLHPAFPMGQRYTVGNPCCLVRPLLHSFLVGERHGPALFPVLFLRVGSSVVLVLWGRGLLGVSGHNTGT